MPEIRKNLLQLIFSGSYMQRWNDKLRPIELLEIDKQAHKMILAFILWQCNAKNFSFEKSSALGLEIIEGGLFEYFYRLIITDIKPPIFYRIKANKEHYRELTKYVLAQLKPAIKPVNEEFWERMIAWYENTNNSSLAARILNAAHLYASSWEFSLIKSLNCFDYEISEIEQDFIKKLEEYQDLEGMGQILAGKNALAAFAGTSGQLRFQIRWTQAPRIPATSVLGHMFVVAAYAYFFSLSVGACNVRCLNNFFSGLIHDLPELLTRDIISPVKHSVHSLPNIIKQYEEEELAHRVLNPLRKDGHNNLVKQIEYYLGLETGSEFNNTICDKQGKVVCLKSFSELHAKNNYDYLNPKDGNLLKMCDMLAAFMEAHSTIRNGVASADIQEAAVRIRSDIREDNMADFFNLGALLADFD